MWGIVPAAGRGSRIQPLAFSKELLPVGSRLHGQDLRPKAVSEYLIERMLRAGARKICITISPGKSDIMEYFGSEIGGASIFYAVQPEARGLCDAVFRALPLIGASETIMVGLPDTVWFPEDGLVRLPRNELAFLLFPVDRPQLFDAVVTDPAGEVVAIDVKSPTVRSRWVWGAFAMPGSILADLHRLWLARGRRDEYIGHLVNAYLERGGRALGVQAGESYVDVGTLDGYHHAIKVLAAQPPMFVPHQYT